MEDIDKTKGWQFIGVMEYIEGVIFVLVTLAVAALVIWIFVSFLFCGAVFNLQARE